MTQTISNTLNMMTKIGHPAGSQAIADMKGPVDIAFNETCARFNLRIDPANLAKASKTFGLDIPASIHGYAKDGGRSALCLGPDDWNIYGDEADKDAIAKAFADLYADAAHSLSDISDRQLSISLKGAQVADLLAMACPRDLSQLAVGSGTRTLFDSVEVLLIKHSDEHFEMEVWRSFLPHVWAMLQLGNQELVIDEVLNKA
ncbi:MAG: sarcosine oxidase [Cohaesibacter sp.]|nr:sarcosine oxidase [Cohaesibacter sp.]